MAAEPGRGAGRCATGRGAGPRRAHVARPPKKTLPAGCREQFAPRVSHDSRLYSAVRRDPRGGCGGGPGLGAALPGGEMSLTAESHRVPLSDGNSIPLLGLGTYADPQKVSPGPGVPRR